MLYWFRAYSIFYYPNNSIHILATMGPLHCNAEATVLVSLVYLMGKVTAVTVPGAAQRCQNPTGHVLYFLHYLGNMPSVHHLLVGSGLH